MSWGSVLVQAPNQLDRHEKDLHLGKGPLKALANDRKIRIFYHSKRREDDGRRGFNQRIGIYKWFCIRQCLFLMDASKVRCSAWSLWLPYPPRIQWPAWGSPQRPVYPQKRHQNHRRPRGNHAEKSGYGNLSLEDQKMRIHIEKGTAQQMGILTGLLMENIYCISFS